MSASSQGALTPTFRSMEVAFFGEEERVPPIEDARVTAFGAGWAFVDWVGRDVVQCPPDFAIREVRDVPDGDDAMVEFINRWGLMSTRSKPMGGCRTPSFGPMDQSRWWVFLIRVSGAVASAWACRGSTYT